MGEQGQIQVYTGTGKGKTTAALGLALRAVCAGKTVFFAQFVKGMAYSELRATEFLPRFVIEQFGRDCFIYRKPTEEDILAARRGLEICGKILKDGDYDLVVLDELNIALHFELFSLEAVFEMLQDRAKHVEVIITGRNAPPELMELADLVTEMKEIKHYYQQGLGARKGIEF